MSRLPPDFHRRVAEAARRAVHSGALKPVATRLEQREVDGLAFQLRLPTVDAGPTVKRPRHPDRNPFLRPDPALRVCDLGCEYYCLLNKYPVARHHLLIVSRHFRPQQRVLTDRDLTMLLEALEALPGVGFFNGGPRAGASQPHRHLQLVPEAGLGALPLDSWLQRGQTLPFAHRHTELPEGRVEKRARVLKVFYRRALEAWGYAPDREGLLPPYNLLLSRRWALLVPRTRGDYRGLSINALGFTGTLWLPDPAPPAWLVREGIAPALSAVTR